MVFRVDVELCFGTAAPAIARAYADELAVLFAPEKFPGDVGVELAARKADLHDVCKAEHVLFAHGIFHRAEFRHDDWLCVAAIVLADGGHRFAEVFRVQVVRAGIVVAIACMVQVVGVAVEIVVVESLCVFFKVVVANAERFWSEDFRRIGERTHRIAHSLECLLVTGNFTCFGGFKQSFFVGRFHIGFVLEADVVRDDSHLFVGLQGGFPPVGKFAIDVFAVRVVA